MNAPLQAPPIPVVLPTADARLERALLDELARRNEASGSLGELQPLAVRLGLMQGSLQPQLRDPSLVIAAGDHGMAVDGIPAQLRLESHQLVRQLLQGRLPLGVLAGQNGMPLSVIDAGLAERLEPCKGLLQHKVAHGTRNARMGPAMSLAQTQAAIQTGMEIASQMPGNVVLCAGLGVGSRESAALILSRLTDTPVRELLVLGPQLSTARQARLLSLAQAALSRHPDAIAPLDVLAAFGGFETAVLVGLMLSAAAKRHLILVDGSAALAALMVASRLAPPVTDYCVFCRSHPHSGLDRALALFRASPVLEMGMDTIDGTGAVLAWPLVNSACAVFDRATPPTAVHDARTPRSARPAPSVSGQKPG